MSFRRMVFALVPLVVLVVGGEVGLRLVGWEGDTDRTVSWCREHSLNEPPFFPLRTVARGRAIHVPQVEGHPIPFVAEKPANVRRIFALGGSAVHGFGFTRAGAWPDRLEGLLAGAWEGTGVEVINAGVVAWSSQQVLMLVKDILAHHEPAALVVYSGNNELLEWFDARQYLPPKDLTRWVGGIRWSRRLRRLRLYQWIDGWIGMGRVGGRKAGHWGQTEFTDDEALPWPDRARLSDKDRNFAASTFQAHLERILELAEDAGVPVVLVSVAVNETETPAEFDFGSVEPVEVRELLEEAAGRWDRGDKDGAGELFQEAKELWPEAITHYRWGMALRERGASAEARAQLQTALHLDENPHRATERRNVIVRNTGRSAAAFVDVADLLSERALDGIVDGSLIYDYCHPTPAVHAVIAQAIGESLVNEVWPGGRIQDPPEPAPGHVDAWLGQGVEPAVGHYVRDPGTEMERWWKAAVAATERGPESALGWLHRGVVAWHGFHADCDRGKLPCLGDALTAFHTATTLDPELCAAWANLGRFQFTTGMSDAGASLKQAVLCDSTDARSAWYLDRLKVRSLP